MFENFVPRPLLTEAKAIEHLKGRGEDRYIKPGTRVCIPWVDDEGIVTPEVGVVIHCWLDEHDVHDCYVAFFGTDFPTSEPNEKPYVLRYAAVSLDEFAD